MDIRTRLRQAGEVLIDIHGQNEHQSLLRESAYLGLIDRYLGDRALGLSPDDRLIAYAELVSDNLASLHVYAIGANPRAAEQNGVPVRRVTWAVYMIVGFACSGSSTPPMPTPPERWTFFPICAQEPTVAQVSTIVPSPTQAPRLT